MDIKKIQAFENLTPQSTPGVGRDIGKGPSFKETMDQVGQLNPAVAKDGVANTSALKNIADGVKFSNHAIDRMRTRGISFNPEDMTRLNEAVGRAASKGSKDSLILMNDSALIVSVKNKTVVTVMDKSALKENVFTNIDSTIVM